jgi:hypothetical protein
MSIYTSFKHDFVRRNADKILIKTKWKYLGYNIFKYLEIVSLK